MSSSNGDAKPPLDLSTLFIDAVTSADYVNHRTCYSEEVFQIFADYCKETLQDLNLALDVGCGPGNSTVGLTKHFKQVIGVDISDTQIAAAPKDIPNCQFKVASSHDLPFIETGSVDLFASGLAFNFMPQKETFAEADRVLRPGGTIAIFGYGPPRSADKRLNDIFQEGFKLSMPYLPKECMQPLEDYKNIEMPYPGWIRKEGITFTHKMSAEGILGMCRLMQRIIDEFVKPKDAHTGFLQTMEALFATATPEGGGNEFPMEYDAVILLGRKPMS